MRIACPSCAVEYEVPASRLASRKMVRCARCGGEWIPVHATVEETPVLEAEPVEHPPAPLLVPDTVPAFSAMDRLAAAAAHRPPRTGLIAAWVLTFVVLTGAVAATITWREAIVRAWPASALLLGSVDHGVSPPATPPDKKAE